MTEQAILVDGVISKGGPKLERMDHPTEKLDGNHLCAIGWHSRAKFLQDIIEVRGASKYVDKVCCDI